MAKVMEITQIVTSRSPKEVQLNDQDGNVVGRVVELSRGKYRWDVVENGEHKVWGALDGTEATAITTAKDRIIAHYGSGK